MYPGRHAVHASADAAAHPCHWANFSTPSAARFHGLPGLAVCTHDPAVDAVISGHVLSLREIGIMTGIGTLYVIGYTVVAYLVFVEKEL